MRDQKTIDAAHRWADKFLDHQTLIIAQHLVQVAPAEDDYHKCTDLLMNYARISLRVRKHADLKYKREFTIRSASKGNDTEAQKLRERSPEYLLYGFSNKKENALEFWVLADMFKISAKLEDPDCPKKIFDNHDGTMFYVLHWRDFKDSIIAHK